MGMYAHLVPVNAASAADLAARSDEELRTLLRGPDSTNINKSWEAAFPLVGSIAGTGMFLVEEPVPVGSDLGFGPAMFIDPEQVADIAARLASADEVTVEEHWATLESPFMGNGLYEDENGKEFAMDGYAKTVRVFVSAAAASQGVLFAIM